MRLSLLELMMMTLRHRPKSRSEEDGEIRFWGTFTCNRKSKPRSNRRLEFEGSRLSKTQASRAASGGGPRSIRKVHHVGWRCREQEGNFSKQSISSLCSGQVKNVVVLQRREDLCRLRDYEASSGGGNNQGRKTKVTRGGDNTRTRVLALAVSHRERKKIVLRRGSAPK